MDLDADHKRPRFWLVAVKDNKVFEKVAKHVCSLPKLKAKFWQMNPYEYEIEEQTVTSKDVLHLRMASGGGFAVQLKAVEL